MTFNLDGFHEYQKPYPQVFNFKKTMSVSRYNELDKKFDGCVDKDEVFERLRDRMSGDYFNHAVKAQTSAISFSEYMFPAYKYLLPDVLMDDWLSIICPHKKGKRDHSLHQPLTAYIVAELLGVNDSSRAFVIDKQTLLSRCAHLLIDEKNTHTAYLRQYFLNLYQREFPLKSKRMKEMWAERLFSQAAIMAALFHDIGYPWQFLYLLGKGPSNVELIANPVHAAQQVINEIENRLLVYPFYGYSLSSKHLPVVSYRKELLLMIQDAIHKTHGFPGALAFTYLNDVVRDYPADLDFEGATCRFIQDWAAVAIMMHDMVRLYRSDDGEILHPQYKLRFDTDPLSCLIAMADILEEFGRPAASFKSYTHGTVTRYNYPCDSTIVDVNQSTLEIIYTYSNKSDAAQYRPIREKEVNAYFNSDNCFIDMKAIGLNNAHCVVNNY